VKNVHVKILSKHSLQPKEVVLVQVRVSEGFLSHGWKLAGEEKDISSLPKDKRSIRINKKIAQRLEYTKW
jgi:hypothetical protein